MRPLILVSILALAAFSGQAAPAQERAGKGRTNMFRAAYEAPKDPKHLVYYEQSSYARRGRVETRGTNLAESLTADAREVRVSQSGFAHPGSGSLRPARGGGLQTPRRRLAESPVCTGRIR